MPNLFTRGPLNDVWIPTPRYKYEGPGLNGEDQFHRFLTEEQQGMGCHCDNPIPAFYSSLKGERSWQEAHLPIGEFCARCLLPKWTSILDVIEDCESCNFCYVTLAKPENFPVKHKLCENCKAKVPQRPKRRHLKT